MKKLLCALLFVCTAGLAQVQAPAPSPHAKMEQKVGLTNVSVEYSRPGMKGRNIFGDLVPYGSTWRTGANMNTIVTFGDDVKINGKDLPQGSYALYTVPNEDSWDIMFYDSVDNPGLPQEWDDSKVVLKTSVAPATMPFNVETFTILIQNLTNNSATLELVWDDTLIEIPFTVPTDTKTMKSIETVMNGPNYNDYYAAASYYHSEGKDLQKAYEWITTAAEKAGDRAFWILKEKSLIEAKMGKKKEAIATAKKSLASAEKAGNADYVKMNKENIAKWEGSK